MDGIIGTRSVKVRAAISKVLQALTVPVPAPADAPAKMSRDQLLLSRARLDDRTVREAAKGLTGTEPEFAWLAYRDMLVKKLDQVGGT